MRQFFITVIGTIVGIFTFFILLFILLGAIGAAVTATDTQKTTTSGTILTLDLRKGLRDHNSGTPLFGERPLSVVDIARSLNKAKSDANIKGLFIRANEYGMVPASAEEIRLALLDFKTSGKFILTHSQGFEGTSIMPYFAISASDEIWQQDTTGFSAAGLHSEMGFYGGVFEKIGAKAEFEQFYEYKNAANTYTQSGLTEAHRESTTSYLSSLYNIAVTAIAADRDMDIDTVKTLLSTAPRSAEAAMEAGLTDTLGHVQEARDYAKEKAGGDKASFKTLRSYGVPGFNTGSVIAFVGGQGTVVTGGSEDGSNPFSRNLTMGGDTISAAIQAATKDKTVKAIVFRVSTPGGSPSASDQIHDAIARAQDAGKPVVISMGQYAASGGYYVSANADKIVALPSTITGSIGVLGGKVALRDTYAKIGYNVEAIDVGGDYVGAYSGDEPFTQSQRKAYHDQLEDIYNDFTTRVATGRNIPIDRVKEIAKGRVWTGAQAKDRGLVDAHGGIMKAIEMARELAEIDADKKIYLKMFPRPKTTQQQIEQLFGASASLAQSQALMQELAEMPEVKAALEARRAAKMDGSRVLLAPLPDIQ